MKHEAPDASRGNGKEQRGTAKEKGRTEQHEGVRKGEEMPDSEGKEPGRHEREETEAGRPAGGSTARDSTGVNPEKREPIDPDSPTSPSA